MLCRPEDGALLYRLRLDERAGLLRGEAAGCWTLDQTDRYLADLDRLVVAVRRVTGKARVLLDRRDVSVQSPEVAARLAHANGTIFAGDDRIALVVPSSLIKVDLRHRMPHAGSKAFLSISAAETWLSA